MKKMPCLFVREFQGRSALTITEAITPGCEWALAGEGVATRKWDGTACMVKDGVLYKRYDAKRDRKTNEYRLPPEGAIPCDEPDPVTGHWPHWVKVGAEPESKWHREAWDARGLIGLLDDGTYELCGPAIGGNPEQFETHTFVRHGGTHLVPDLSFGGLREFLRDMPIEGIVFHHPDGRMCKIRRADFGYAWNTKKAVQS